jgi:hypothetical protein
VEYAQSVSLSVTKETLKSRILDQKKAVHAFTKLSMEKKSLTLYFGKENPI